MGYTPEPTQEITTRFEANITITSHVKARDLTDQYNNVKAAGYKEELEIGAFTVFAENLDSLKEKIAAALTAL